MVQPQALWPGMGNEVFPWLRRLIADCIVPNLPKGVKELVSPRPRWAKFPTISRGTRHRGMGEALSQVHPPLTLSSESVRRVALRRCAVDPPSLTARIQRHAFLEGIGEDDLVPCEPEGGGDVPIVPPPPEVESGMIGTSRSHQVGPCVPEAGRTSRSCRLHQRRSRARPGRPDPTGVGSTRSASA